MNSPTIEENRTEHRVFWGTLLVVVSALGFLFIGGCLSAWEKMVSMGCGHQLKQIGMQCRIYADQHDGHFPTKWAQLNLEKEGNWPKLFKCPKGGHAEGTWANVDLWCDYRLIAGCTTSDPPNTVLAIESLANHKAKGANVLFVNGSTAWWPLHLIVTNR